MFCITIFLVPKIFTPNLLSWESLLVPMVLFDKLNLFPFKWRLIWKGQETLFVLEMVRKVVVVCAKIKSIFFSTTELRFWTCRSKEIFLEYDPSTPTYSRRNWSYPDKDLIRSGRENKGDLKNQSFPLNSYPNLQKLVYCF